MNNFFLNAYNLNERLRNKEMVNESIFGNLGLDKSLDAAIWEDFITNSMEKLKEISASQYFTAGKDEKMYKPAPLEDKTHFEYWVGKFANVMKIKYDVPDTEFFSAHQDDMIKALCDSNRTIFLVSPETIGSDPVDFSNLPIKFDAPSMWSNTPCIIIYDFKNLRSLKGFINLKYAHLCIWNCPKLKSLDGVKIKEPNSLGFFPDAVDGKTLGEPKYGLLDVCKELHIIYKNEWNVKRFFTAKTEMDAAYANTNKERNELLKSKMDKAIERSNMKNQFGDDDVKLEKPKTVHRAAPIVKSADGETSVLYKDGNMLYSDPEHKNAVGLITKNGITVYRIRNGVRTTQHWLNYDYNSNQCFTHPKGTLAYVVK